MEFPHLSDTSFPNIGNVDVYSYHNNFDYTRWVERSHVRLTNVLWDAEYNDVVKFDNNEARDEWFDTQSGAYEITLTRDQSIPPEGGIKLPIPFDVASRYNYMVVDVPVMTSAEDRIEYETDDGIRRWFFFVNDVSSRAPNTTMFHISLDVWTQYQNDLDIEYLYLERGHAPVAATDTDTYLADPIGNNDYLLTPDVTPSDSNIVRSSTFIPFGNGAKYVCIATTCPPSAISSLGAVIHDSPDYTYGNITYSDIDARYGYQLQVNGFGIGSGDDYTNLNAPSSPVAKNGRIANNVWVLAIASSEVYGSGTFFEDVMRTSPSFMNTIQGCFVVDESMLALGDVVMIAGHRLHVAEGSQNQVNIPTLTRADFDFPERYQRFAKLYTFPYSTLELTDNEGNTRTVRIENTGKMTAQLITQLAFPFVNTRMMFTGINGSGSYDYTWKNLNGSETTLSMQDSDWFEYCFDHEIPCYALYMDAQTAWYLDNFNSALNGGRRNALVSYHNAVRSANTARANSVDSANTMKANADADAATMNANAANTASTNTANSNATQATNTSKTSRANSTSQSVTGHNNELVAHNAEVSIYASSTTAKIENETTAATTFNSGVGGVIGGMVSGAASGAMMGVAAGGVGAAPGAALGAMVGGVSAAVGWGASNANAIAVIQGNSAAVGVANSASTSNSLAAQTTALSVTGNLNMQRVGDNSDTNSLLATHTANNNSCLVTNTGNSAATLSANAGRTSGTNSANAGHTREVGVLNAKETLENARNGGQFAMLDATMARPVAVGAYAGDPTADYMRTRGVQVKVRTMQNAEVRQVGDWFARFGYALNQVWDVAESGLCPMRHFCYWKAHDVWVDDRSASNADAQSLVKTILTRGVTVWHNPDEIGRVSIYDN
jgi:hypothetical protein